MARRQESWRSRRNAIKSTAGAIGAGLIAGCLGDESNGDGTGDGTGDGSGDGTGDDTDDGNGSGAEFPQDDITLINPFAPGGGTDAYLAYFVDPLDDTYGVNVSQEYIPGAGGLSGVLSTYREDDEHTAVVLNVPTAIISQWDQGLGEQGIDFTEMTPICRFAWGANAVLTRSGEVSGIDEVVDAFESGEFTHMGATGVGSREHMAGWLAKQHWGLDYDEWIGYDGGGPTIAALLQGEIDVGMPTLTPAIPHIEEGDVDVHLVFSNEPHPAMPDIPTAEEEGLSPEPVAPSNLNRTMVGGPSMSEEAQQGHWEAWEEMLTMDSVQEWSEDSGNAIMVGGPEEVQTAINQTSELEEDFEEFQASL